MIYREEERIRAHDPDLHGEVRPSVLWRYMQETANHNMRDEGPSYDEMWERGLSFLLSRVTLDIKRPLAQYAPIAVETWACLGGGLSFDRAYRILSEGEVVAEAVGTWALLDVKSGRLLRVSDVELGYSTDAPLPLAASAKFRIPRGTRMEKVGEREIYYSDVDRNGHMNNTNYPDFVTDLLPNRASLSMKRVSLSFLHDAPLGAHVSFYLGEGESPADGIRRYYVETRMGDVIGVQAEILAEEREGRA